MTPLRFRRMPGEGTRNWGRSGVAGALFYAYRDFFGAAALSNFPVRNNEGKPNGSAALITIRRMPEWRDREAGKIVAS